MTSLYGMSLQRCKMCICSTCLLHQTGISASFGASPYGASFSCKTNYVYEYNAPLVQDLTEITPLTQVCQFLQNTRHGMHVERSTITIEDRYATDRPKPKLTELSDMNQAL